MDDDLMNGGIDRRTALQMMTLLGGFAAALPGAAAPPTQSSALWNEIDAVLRKTEEIWNSQHFFRLKDVWDADDPEPWYVPEEIETPFRTWPELEKYWGPGRRVLRAFRWKFSNLRVKALAPDLTLFRKKPDGWKHILYAQCPLGPDTYLKTLRQKIVQPDFESFRDQTDAEYKQRHGADRSGTPRP